MSKLHAFKNVELNSQEQANTTGEWGGWGGYSFSAPAVHIPSFSFSIPKIQVPTIKAPVINPVKTVAISHGQAGQPGQPGQSGKVSFGGLSSGLSGLGGLFSKFGGLFGGFGGGKSYGGGHGWW